MRAKPTRESFLFLFGRSCYMPFQLRQEEIMKRNRAAEHILPADWTEVVGKVQEILTQAEKAAGEREQALAQIAASIPSADKAAAWKEGLEQFEEQLRLFDSGVQKAEDQASEAELVSADGEKALEDWLARVAGLTNKVAKNEESGPLSNEFSPD
jgi:chromosome segregation ATPase